MANMKDTMLIASVQEHWKPPSMPWFEGDFFGSFNVRKMKPMARLMYRSLLAQCWHSDRPPYLPNDEADLSVMADAPTPEEWDAHKETILARFKKTEDGLWLYHPKAVREYARARHEHDRKVAAGSQRWSKQSTSTAPALHQQADTAPLSSHSHSHNHNQPTTTTTATTKRTGTHSGVDPTDTAGLRPKGDGSFGF
jgi:hypothetical protein